jgi:hypothetical protein
VPFVERRAHVEHALGLSHDRANRAGADKFRQSIDRPQHLDIKIVPPPRIERQLMQPLKLFARITIADIFGSPGAHSMRVVGVIEQLRLGERQPELGKRGEGRFQHTPDRWLLVRVLIAPGALEGFETKPGDDRKVCRLIGALKRIEPGGRARRVRIDQMDRAAARIASVVEPTE